VELTPTSIPGFAFHKRALWHIVKNFSREKGNIILTGHTKKDPKRGFTQRALSRTLCGCRRLNGAFGEIDLLPAPFTDVFLLKLIGKNFRLLSAVWAFALEGF